MGHVGNGLTLSLRMAIARVFPPYVSTLYWCAALPANTQISVGFFFLFCFVLFCLFVCLFLFFFFFFYGHCERSYNIECGMF